MKNFMKAALFVCALLICSASLMSYVNRPMFGTSPNQDNTGRVLTYSLTSIADTAGTTIDTILLVPSSYEKTYVLTCTDSCVLAVKSTASSFTASKMNLIINASAATVQKIKFLGYSGLATQWTMTSTFIAPTASKTATMSWICTGTKWAELYRAQDL